MERELAGALVALFDVLVTNAAEPVSIEALAMR
jgi:hypothetical protein